MNSSDILRLRLQNQQISKSNVSSIANVVYSLGAMQAQDYMSAKWAIGLRLPGIADNDIETAIANKEIVRTWALRGTLHFLTPMDIRWILDLLSPRLIRLYASNYQRLGLDQKILYKSQAILIKILKDGKQLTRAAIKQALEAKGIPTGDMRISFILLRAALIGLICLGSRSGKEHTYVLLDEWLPQTKPLAREDAIRELAKRYFVSHGPATIQDFAWWSGLPGSDINAVMEELKYDLEKINIKNVTYWMGKDQPLTGTSRRAYLLPAFDEYLVSYKDRTIALASEHIKKIIGPNGLFYPTIIINGKVVGNWKRVVKKNKVFLETNSFTPLSALQKSSILVTAKSFGKFLNLPLDVMS